MIQKSFRISLKGETFEEILKLNVYLIVNEQINQVQKFHL